MENGKKNLGAFDFQPSQPATDNGSQIDVMIVYTAAVRTALGGATQAQTFARQAVASTNTAYLNSSIAVIILFFWKQEFIDSFLEYQRQLKEGGGGGERKRFRQEF